MFDRTSKLATLERPTVRSSIGRTLALWPARRWIVAFGFAVATVLVMGLSTAMIPNPVFGRAVPTTDWAWPTLLVTAVLGGLVGATYVRTPGDPAPVTKAGVVGGLLSYFAVGCPVCNKLVLLALGYSGALQWFAPAQPFLAAAGLALLAYALVRRLRAAASCPAPARS